MAEPPRANLRGGFSRARIELFGRDRAQRVRDHDRLERFHAERGALHEGFVLEDGGDDDGGRNP
jgi:hypothetical protein